MIFFLFKFWALYCMCVCLFASLLSRPPGAKKYGKRSLLIQGRMQIFEQKLVFLVHFKPWDLSRKMRRESLTEFATAIIDFENKNISIVQNNEHLEFQIVQNDYPSKEP